MSILEQSLNVTQFIDELAAANESRAGRIISASTLAAGLLTSGNCTLDADRIPRDAVVGDVPVAEALATDNAAPVIRSGMTQPHPTEPAPPVIEIAVEHINPDRPEQAIMTGTVEPRETRWAFAATMHEELAKAGEPVVSTADIATNLIVLRGEAETETIVTDGSFQPGDRVAYAYVGEPQPAAVPTPAAETVPAPLPTPPAAEPEVVAPPATAEAQAPVEITGEQMLQGLSQAYFDAMAQFPSIEAAVQRYDVNSPGPIIPMEDWARINYAAGFQDRAVLIEAVAVLWAESNGAPFVTNTAASEPGDFAVAVGGWQILQRQQWEDNPSEDWRDPSANLDPLTNANSMHRLYERRGGTFQDSEAWQNDMHLQYMGAAQEAVDYVLANPEGNGEQIVVTPPATSEPAPAPAVETPPPAATEALNNVPDYLNHPLIDPASVRIAEDGNHNPIEVVHIGGELGNEVGADIALQAARMIEAAAADGITIGITSGFRDIAQQEQARRDNGCPDVYESPPRSCTVAPTAIPGTSEHNFGHALDLNTAGQDIDNATVAWLRTHAVEYGFFELDGEPWHWSTTGR